MKNLIKNTGLILLFFFGIVNRILPKFNIIMFYSNNYYSNDNNIALLSKMVSLNFNKKYKIYFFSKGGIFYSNFENVRYKWIFYAPFYFLFSKFCFYDCGTLKIKPSSDQKVISLWHGVPLKKVGLMLKEQSSKIDRYNDFHKILVPHRMWLELYVKSFGCKENQLLISGFPRNDFLFTDNKLLLQKLNVDGVFKSKILWMPTFRVSINGRYHDGVARVNNWDLPLFDSVKDLILLNDTLFRLEALLVIKLHPYSTLNNIDLENMTNLKFVTNKSLNEKGVVNYEFVSCFDGLISDYSSVIIDYLLTDKPMAITIDDLDKYSLLRGFGVRNIDDFLIGQKVHNIDDLVSFVKNVSNNNDVFIQERQLAKKKMHHYIDERSTERILSYIGLE